MTLTNKALLLCLLLSTGAQGQFEVQLHINHEYKASAVVSFIDFSRSLQSPVAGSQMGIAPGNVRLLVRRSTIDKVVRIITVDSDDDGRFDDEVSQLIAPDSSIIIDLSHRFSGGAKYILSYSAEDGNNGVQEKFGWRPHYRAEGYLEMAGERKLVVVTDLNGDGEFGASDYGQGTTIGIDRDGDGRIWGSDEWRNGAELFTFGDQNFLIQEIDTQKLRIKFIPADFNKPKLGEHVPPLWIKTTEGRIITSSDLSGKVVILNFWASWCGHCVAAFPLLKKIHQEHAEALTIIIINVDAQDRVEMARQIIKDNELDWASVITGRGFEDVLWKQFGSEHRMSIPLYGLIDDERIVQYIGSGGIDLIELKSKIAELLLEN